MDRIALETVVFNKLAKLLAEKPSYIDAVLWYRDYESMEYHESGWQPSLLFCKRVVDAIRFYRFEVAVGRPGFVYVDLAPSRQEVG